jgi:NAD(P)-dependent dehydrogenase (short-subunit alcohol dehydrogenase family)
MNNSHTFADKVVLVTGGTSGIGKTTAIAFYPASDAAKFTIGTSLVVDGGFIAG